MQMSFIELKSIESAFCIYCCRLIVVVVVVIDDNNEQSLSKETNKMKSSCSRYDDLLINVCMQDK